MAIPAPLHLHMTFRITLSRSTKGLAGNGIWIVLNLCIVMGRMGVFTKLALPIYEYAMSLIYFYFLWSIFCSFQYTSPIHVCYIYTYFVCVFFWMVVNGVVFLIPVSMCSLLVCRNTVNFAGLSYSLWLCEANVLVL